MYAIALYKKVTFLGYSKMLKHEQRMNMNYFRFSSQKQVNLPASSDTKTAARAAAPVNRAERQSKRTPSQRRLAKTIMYD